MYIYFILIGITLLIIISIVILTVFVVKNVVKKEINEDASVGQKTDWGHIKDFSDINATKSSKVSSFKDEFDDEVHTVGANFIESRKDVLDSNNVKENNIEKKSLEKFDENVGEISKADFINDFKTMSIDSEVGNNASIPQIQNNANSNTVSSGEIDYDATVSIDEIDYDATRSLDDFLKNKIKVTLKYKDSKGIKIQQMNTEQMTVGRGIGNDLLFRSDSFTSRNHAIFNIRNNELYIKDLNSKNGTFINKTEKVENEVKLEENCEITFGDITVEVIIEK